MISCHPISDLLYVRCHTGAYYCSGWDLQILVQLYTYPHLWDMRQDDDLFTIFTMIPQWGLSRVARLGLHFSTLRCHHTFLLGNAPSIYGSDSVTDMGDLGRTFDDGGFWAHLIFRLVTFWCHTGVCSLFWLGFVDSPLICVITPGYEIHIRSMIWFHFILILQGVILESFSQIHTLWYSCDSWTKLSQARGFLHHHFSGVHIGPFMHPHRVILELSWQIGYVWHYTGTYFPHSAAEAIVLSQIHNSFHHSAEIYCICLTDCYTRVFCRDELSVEHNVRVLIAQLAMTLQWIVTLGLRPHDLVGRVVRLCSQSIWSFWLASRASFGTHEISFRPFPA